MDITNIMNNKNGGMHHQQALPGHLSLMKHDPIMERSASPHGSEHSHYSTNSIARSYTSQGPMQTPMHMSPIPNGMQMTGYPDMHGMHGMTNLHMQHIPQQPQEEPPQPLAKAYPCSTCGKGFARRSDLARHGKSKR